MDWPANAVRRQTAAVAGLDLSPDFTLVHQIPFNNQFRYFHNAATLEGRGGASDGAQKL
jgi:hypothetical protein